MTSWIGENYEKKCCFIGFACRSLLGFQRDALSVFGGNIYPDGSGIYQNVGFRCVVWYCDFGERPRNVPHQSERCLDFLFKEKITKQKILALLVLFSGCACAAGVFSGEQLITLTGVVFGILAGLCYGLYSIFTRLAMEKGYAGFTFAFYVIAVSAVGAIPFVDFGHFVPALGDANGFLCFAVALMNCFLPYLLFTQALASLLPGDAAMLATSEPVIAAMLSVFVLGEAITASVVLGICLIVIGILIVNGGVKKKTE